jgi:uncharacterized OB-fold protein
MQVTRHWREFSSHYRLEGSRCTDCETVAFPPRDVCRECGSTETEGYELDGEGELRSYTEVTSPPTGHEDQTPYYLAMVELDEGPIVTGQLTDTEVDGFEPEIGARVELVVRRIKEQGEDGLILYAYKFRPAL